MAEEIEETRDTAVSEIRRYLAGHQEVLGQLGSMVTETVAAAERIVSTLKGDGTVWLAGNGGSAADAQHIAAELEGRFLLERPARAVHLLTANLSTITSIGNDYGFDHIFARQVEGYLQPGDLLWVFSTSGQSPNLVRAVEAAKGRKIKVIGCLGKGGGVLRELCDLSLVVPADHTPWIQESHITLGHMICMLVDRLMIEEEL
jgi:D-sedoheptulose 7-phosphate isomerase